MPDLAESPPAAPSESSPPPDSGAQPFSTAPNVQPAEGERPPDFSKLGIKPDPVTPEPKPVPEGEIKETVKVEPAPPPIKEGELKPDPIPEPAKPKTDFPKDHKPASKEEIDSFTLKKGAPERVVKSFREVTDRWHADAEAARKWQAEVEQVRKENEELKKSPGLTDEIKTRIAKADHLLQILVDENDPEVQKRLDAGFSDADKSFWELMKSDDLGLDDVGVAEFKKHLDEHYDPAWIEENIFKPLESDRVMKRKVEKAFDARNDARDARHKEMERIKTDRASVLSEVQKSRQIDGDKWVEKARARTIELGTKYATWAAYKTVPENATPEQKAAVESYNKEVDGRAVKFRDLINDIYERDPEKTVEAAFRSFHADYQDEQVASKDKEIETLNARIKELEELIAGARSVGRQAPVKQAPAGEQPRKQEGIGGDPQEAINRFFDKR